MKKITILSVLVLSILLSTVCFAKTGDKIGNIYSTDIVTYLNGREIESVNIGGKTLIKAEDMKYFGFFVAYNDEQRTLSIDQSTLPRENNYSVSEKQVKKVGRIVGNYYETDIKTYLDNNLITAFNAGGVTYILAEEMINYGYEVIWDAYGRTLSVSSPAHLGYVYDIELSRTDFTSNGEYEDISTGSFNIDYNSGEIKVEGDAKLFDTQLYYDGETYLFSVMLYQNQGLFHSAALQEKLDALVYESYDQHRYEASELYDIVNQNITIMINGNLAKNVAVSKAGGNGHVDYYFEVEGLPKVAKNDLEEIKFVLKKNKNEQV